MAPLPFLDPLRAAGGGSRPMPLSMPMPLPNLMPAPPDGGVLRAGPAGDPLAAVVADALGLVRGERVLEIGCGDGSAGAWAAERVGPEGEVVGIDPLPLVVVLAGRRHPRFATRPGCIEDLSDFGDASFDAISLNGMLHRVPMPSAALAQARRVLKPGGRLCIAALDPDRPHEAEQLLHEALHAEGALPAACPTETALPQGPTLRRLLEDNAFVQAEWQAHAVVDRVADVDRIPGLLRDSRCGLQLSELAPEVHRRVRARLAELLERRRGAHGIELRRHYLIALGRRPSYATS